MLGSIPMTEAVTSDKKLAQRLHINGNALYHIGDQNFAAFLQEVENNNINPTLWQVNTVLYVYTFFLSCLPWFNTLGYTGASSWKSLRR